MLCPHCTNETPDEQAFCINCGAFVRTRFGKVFAREERAEVAAPAQTDPWRGATDQHLAEVDWDSVSLEPKTDESEQVLWPTETVFAPTPVAEIDEQEKDAPLATETIFEDAQADDFFEQSLSGKIRREDLLASLETVADEPVSEIPSPAQTQEIFVAEPVTAQTQTNFHATMPEVISESVIWPAKVDSEISYDEAGTGKRRRPFLTAIKHLFLSLVLFGGGVAIGVWLGRFPTNELLTETVVPPVSTEKILPVAPSGMAYVPGGEFMMGSDVGDALSKPAHKVSVDAFFMDVTEVTNKAYLEFIRSTGHDPPADWKDGTYAETAAELPVTGITWYDAAEYAAWLGKRLPTEAEWEFAARGTDGRTYPWGNDWDPSLANASGNSKGLRSVGQGGRSPFGLYDMAGNAWEWTSSDARSYPGSKQLPWSRLRLKIIRGGNWLSNDEVATTFFRGYYGASGEREYNGTSFRCVKDIAKDK